MGTKSEKTNNGNSGIITVGHFALMPHSFYVVPWTEVSRVMPRKMQSDFIVYMWKNNIKRKNDGIGDFIIEKFLKEYYGKVV